ncbi:MAG: hypothetical protein HPY59_10270 [Anaerolineae bacterium]|nr:hypothetical protein [Anaerolineae bacterium]
MSGYPFAANPLSGIWYLPNWLMLITPQPWGFNLLVTIHILWGAIGLYNFLRLMGVNCLASMSGALSFALMPKLWAHYGAGHVSLIFAVSWTPWLLFLEKKWKLFQTSRGRFAPGIVWGLTILADVRWAFYSGLLWTGYSLHSSIYEDNQSLRKSSGEGICRAISSAILGWARVFAAQVCVGLLIASPLLLPLFEYMKLSTRNSLAWSDTFILSLPPAHLAGLAIPDFAGYFEWIVYPGVVSFFALVLSLGNGPLRRRVRLWLFVIIITLVVALGENARFLTSFLKFIPGWQFLRVPPRALFLAGIAFSILISVMTHYYSEQDFAHYSALWGERFVFAIAAMLVMFAGGLLWVTGQVHVAFLWSAILSLVFLTLFLLRRQERIPPVFWSIAMIVIVVIDLGTVVFTLVRFKPADDLFSDNIRAARYIQAQNGTHRTYSPSYSIPQHIAALYGLELADGIDPLQLRDYADFFPTASGVPQAGYSVTLPPYSTGDPEIDNRGYLPDAKKLGLLNVRFVVSSYDILANGLLLRARFGATRVYENLFVLPRAWLRDVGEQGEYDFGDVEISRRSANRIEISVNGPGTLILSEVYYPGWIAFIDGDRTDIQKTGGLFRSVVVPEGRHIVRFVFRPISVFIGMGLSVLTWMIILIVCFKNQSAYV